MQDKLKELLNYAFTKIDYLCFSCIVEMKNGELFKGVNVKNSVFRDTIYAEQAAISQAVTAGYKKEDFLAIHIMVGSKDFNEFRYLSEETITEFFDFDCEVHLYNIFGEERIINVENLVNHVYAQNKEE